MQEMVQYYEILEVEIGAPQDEIKSAYRDMVNVWHPDRFGSNDRLKERAEEKLKVINNAYDKLKDYQPTDTEIEKYKKSQGANIVETVNDIQTVQNVSDVTPQEQSFGAKLKKWSLIGFGIFFWLVILGNSPPAGMILGTIAVGVYFWKKKAGSASGSSTVKEKANTKTLDKSSARKLIIENLILLAKSDGHLDDTETEIIDQVIKSYWPNEAQDVLLSEAVNRILNCNSTRELYEQNTKTLSKLLDKKEKLEVLAVAEMLIKADGSVTDEEKFSYALLKKLLKPTGVASSIMTVFSDKCPVCISTRVKLLKVEEIDRWKGTKTVHEKLASGKTKTKTVQTTYVNIKRTYKCDECNHAWYTESKEEK